VTPLLVLAPAKLNLSLCVLAREEGGFHQVETLFCALDLADEVQLSGDTSGLRLDVLAPPESAGPAPDLGPLHDNLAWRAAATFFQRTGLPPAATIRLTKRIPSGAGLGGGSSDAAAVLKALNTMHGRPMSAEALLLAGAQLGSDVPFFVAGCSLAWAWGRGGRLLPLPPLPARPVLLAVPPVAVPTPDAYACLAAGRTSTHVAPPAVLPAALQSWADADAVAANDFEPVIFQRLPLLRDVRDALAWSGARFARMTGTGSALFGIYDDVAAAENAAERLRVRFPDVTFLLTQTAAAITGGSLEV
jgi:4-diphosphocytidyl-2-C-methyl-D-erythritol kinase